MHAEWWRAKKERLVRECYVKINSFAFLIYIELICRLD